MIAYLRDKIKAALAWVYNWITVITGIIVGAASVLPDLISALVGIDLAPLIGADRAAQLVTIVAIIKAIVAGYSAFRGA